MSILNLTSGNTLTVSLQDTISEGLQRMSHHCATELIVLENDEYKALVRATELENYPDQFHQFSIANGLLHFKPFVFDFSHPYDAASQFIELEVASLPVVDTDMKFLGVVTQADLLGYFCEDSGIRHAGSIIVLSLRPINFSLSEIARICESNDATVLNVQTIWHPDEDLMDVVLKTNKRDLQGLKASFQRYEYHIREVYGAMPSTTDLDDRYRLLMNYINM